MKHIKSGGGVQQNGAAGHGASEEQNRQVLQVDVAGQ